MFPNASRDAAVAFFSALCAEMGGGFARACVGGGIAALLVWAVCRGKWGRRIPPTVRFALWWLVCARLVFGVFSAGIVPFFVPISPVAVPPFSAARSVASAAGRVVRPLLLHRTQRPIAAPLPPLRVPVPSAWAMPAQDAIRTASVVATHDENAMVPSPSAALAANQKPDAPGFPAAQAPTPANETDADTANALASPLFWAEAFFVFLYFCGLIVGVWRIVRAARWAQQTVETATKITDPATCAAAETVAHAVWGRAGKTPRLRQSPSALSPFVAGMVRPALVLPEGFAQTVSPAQLRLALAHEMAHLRRGDLWLQLLPQITQVVLWFFPVVYAVCRECVQAGEEACDKAALCACPDAAARGDLGHLLVRFGQKQPLRAPVPGMAGMAAAPGFARLKRRLRALQPDAPTSRLGKAGAFVLAILCGTSVLPWRISAMAKTEVAAEPKAAPTMETMLPRYEIVDLGLPGETYSDACAISETGLVVGTTGAAETGGRGVAFTFNVQTGRRSDVGTGPYRRSVAVGVSANGTVAALAYNRRSRPQAFTWENKADADAKPSRTFLSPLPGFRYSRASGINDWSVVVGSAHGLPHEGVLPARAFLYRDNTLMDLGTLGGPYSHASAINNSGLVVGKADVKRSNRGETYQTHAFAVQTLPNRGGSLTEPLRDLGTLPGGKNSRAWGVNSQNEIVGFSESRAGQHAFLKTNGAEPLRDLGTLPGRQNSIAYAISDRGWIVGTSSGGATGAVSSTAAVLWIRGNGLNNDIMAVDLNERVPQNSGWVLQTARSINRAGWIVGQGVVNGKQRAFLLKPVGSAVVP